MAKNITPRETDYSAWYGDIIKAADLAEHSDVRGCMVIKPTGYAIWEAVQAEFDRRFKETGHVNAYFPLFIPKSFLAKEASHVEGFAMECAVVTHYGLKAEKQADGSVDVVVDSEKVLEEPLIVRPTSETIINAAYARWVQSYRDLPILINQWANVVRWEMRTRLFLRTAEFLWQEGHTAHATAEEAREEVLRMLDVYAEVCANVLAIPMVRGVKSPAERFAGAVETYTIEALMQNGWALQAGTSHDLGQNFAKAFGTQFLNKNNELEHVYQTSWGVSTRLIGALIQVHSDDEGLVLPPRVAQTQVVLVPIGKADEQAKMTEVCHKVKEALNATGQFGPFGVKVDDREHLNLSDKRYFWEQRGVPLRLEVGPKDVAKGTVYLRRRYDGHKESLPIDGIGEAVRAQLDATQAGMLAKADAFRKANTHVVDSYDEFKERAASDRPGFLVMHWDGTAETEKKIKDETKATIRCIPLPGELEALHVKADAAGKDPVSNKPSQQRVVYARAY